jgi:hypothetical protein
MTDQYASGVEQHPRGVMDADAAVAIPSCTMAPVKSKTRKAAKKRGFINGAIRLVNRGRAEVPMLWTQVMLLGGMGAVRAIAALWHFFFFGV